MKFDKICIVNPPSPPGFVSNKDSAGGFGQLYPIGAPPFPPMDMVYLASYLTERNVPIGVFECLGLALSEEQLVKKLDLLSKQDNNKCMLLIVRTSAPTLDWDLSVCKKIKEKMERIKIAIYGPVIPYVDWRIKKEDHIDYIIRGEPDEIIYDLITDFSQSNIKGLAFRDNGDWVENQKRPWIKDIDELPFPRWEMFPYKEYKLPKSSTSSDMPFLPMLTSRGCPFGCSYCTYHLGQGLNWRFRSAQNVVDEIEYLVKKLGIQYIIFRDPIFSFNQKRVFDICEKIKKRKLYFKWKCETRLDCVSEDTLKAMAMAGCDGINFGIESAEIEIQKKAGRKPIKKEDVISTVTLCRKLGIKTFCFFIIGLPGDTVQTIMESISFAIDLRPNWLQFTAASPLIGTKIREWAISKKLVVEDKYAYINCHKVIMGNENLSKEQVQSLLYLAQFIQNYLINRKGVLKNEINKNFIYKFIKSIADLMGYYLALVVFIFGKNILLKRHL